jgi:hypothetical protein
MDRYGFRGMLTRMSPIGLTPVGLRIDVGFVGSITAGPLSGCTVEGIDYVLIRPDGVAVVDARELVTGDGWPATSLHGEGFIVPTVAMPPLSAIADPDFCWPDVDMPMHGSSRVQAGDERLSAANHTVYGWTGTVNVAQARLEVDAVSLAAHSLAST